MTKTDLTYWCVGTRVAPSRETDRWTGITTYIFPVWPKVPYGIGRRSAYAHHVKAAAGTVRNGVTIYGAQWACGNHSPNAIFLAELGERELCPRCIGRQAVVYRCFNSGGELLYVGSTAHLRGRIRQHESLTPWWPEVADVRHEAFASEPDARGAELRAIKSENPLYNKAHRESRSAA